MLAIMNGGGIRADRTYDAGTVLTRRDIAADTRAPVWILGGGCDWYRQHGRMCPEDAPAILRQYDAIYFGAVGNPAIVPDHVSAWGLLINFRRWFDLYVNLRPVRLFEGLPGMIG